MEPEALPPGGEIRWADPAEEQLQPPDEWWHQHDSEEWRPVRRSFSEGGIPELPLEDGTVLILDADPLPPEEIPVFSIG